MGILSSVEHRNSYYGITISHQILIHLPLRDAPFIGQDSMGITLFKISSLNPVIILVFAQQTATITPCNAGSDIEKQTLRISMSCFYYVHMSIISISVICILLANYRNFLFVIEIK